jgi:CheY-like chemotaxis protein
VNDDNDPVVRIQKASNRLERVQRESAAAREQAENALRASRTRVERIKEMILLVDDFEDGLDIYGEYLTYHGYDVILARDGREAVAQARQHRPDIVLLDLRMPGMTGNDVVRILRSDPSFAPVPIIALTAHALDRERRAALEAGFDEVIAKPCLPNELLAAVGRILRRV